MSKTPAIPEHGVHARGVEWERLYAYLDSLVVQMPEGGPGEPPDGLGVSLLLARVQNNRQKLESLLRLVEERVATTKRVLAAAVEILRTEQAELVAGSARDGHTAAQRRARAELDTSHRRAEVAVIKGRAAAYEGARKAVGSQMETMETAKQTLNSIKALILGGASPDGDEFAGRRQQPRRFQ